MALTEEQLRFRDSNMQIIDVPENLRSNYFQPLIEEENKIIEEHNKTLFGKLGCLGSALHGCVLWPFIVICIWVFCSLSEYGLSGALRIALLVTLPEYFLIVYISNSMFFSEHNGDNSAYGEFTKNLLMKLVGMISMDMRSGDTITLSAVPNGIVCDKYKLSASQIEEMGKKLKRGLSVYSGDIVNLDTVLADGTKLSIDISHVVSSVFVYKKHGPNKSSRKDKITIKTVMAMPTSVYSCPSETSPVFADGGFAATVNKGEIYHKIAVKSICTEFDYEDILQRCIDSIGCVYSAVNAA